MNKYHIGYCGLNGAIYCPNAQWKDLGWVTAKKLSLAVALLMRRNNIQISATQALERGHIKVFEVVKNPWGFNKDEKNLYVS